MSRSKRFKLGMKLAYDRFFIEQEGRCGICKRNDLELFLDHDHECCPNVNRRCGECFRGLLCAGCNVRMGQFDAAIQGAFLAGDKAIGLVMGYYPREVKYALRYIKRRAYQESMKVNKPAKAEIDRPGREPYTPPTRPGAERRRDEI